jgi:hypothetical protein
LELADWILADAIQSAREDNEWEHNAGNNPNGNLRAGEIRVMMNVQKHPDGPILKFSAQGAGYSPKRKQGPSKTTTTPIVAYDAVAVKTVKQEDIHNVAPQHNSFGVELQSLNNKK